MVKLKNKISLQKNSDGYYLPDIKIWDELFEYANLDGNFPEWILKGSIEELILDGSQGECLDCGKELIRIEYASLPSNIKIYLPERMNGSVKIHEYFMSHFQMGIICCPDGIAGSHSKEYWIEVWQNLTDVENNILRLSPDQSHERTFKASNHLIKKCYEFNELDYFQGSEFFMKGHKHNPEDPLPKPSYTHS